MKASRAILILAMLISAGSVALAFLVGGNLNTVKEERDTALDAQQVAEDERALAERNLEEAREDLDNANSRLSQAEDALAQARSALTEQMERADDAETRLTEVITERNNINIELQKWRLTGLSVDQVLTLRDDLSNAKREVAALNAENRELGREVTVLDNRLKLFEEEDYEVKIPASIDARVTAVDPKFAFVVLDVGANRSVLEKAKFSISRGNKLIAKVQVSNVESGLSYANVLPGWNAADIRPGDRAIPSYEAIAQR